MSRRGIKWNVAKPTWVDGIRFPSKAEAKRYSELQLLVKAGQIAGLEMQPTYPIEVINPSNGEVIQVGVYKADFRYRVVQQPLDGRPRCREVVEDVKGMRTPIYALKKKLVEAIYSIQISEIR